MQVKEEQKLTEKVMRDSPGKTEVFPNRTARLLPLLCEFTGHH